MRRRVEQGRRLPRRPFPFHAEIRGGRRLEGRAASGALPRLPAVPGRVPAQASGRGSGDTLAPGQPPGSSCAPAARTGQREAGPEGRGPRSRTRGLCPPTVQAVVFVEENHRSEDLRGHRRGGGSWWAPGAPGPRVDCVSGVQRGATKSSENRPAHRAPSGQVPASREVRFWGAAGAAGECQPGRGGAGGLPVKSCWGAAFARSGCSAGAGPP